ncbi:MAG: CerR family C-terminal domain-containing protein [Desulfovibrio sp.]|uniref:CerR family C-terminal domain-containing protein n=1 Tax=Desulfovibrio sp. 7SRBS1 TaxID=3378064 RepID=UPI003B425D50
MESARTDVISRKEGQKSPDSEQQNARGEETRARILKAGLRLFALHGYHGTGIRTLAAEAGANVAAVNYHFGSKQGLLDSVVDELITSVRALADPLIEQLDKTIAASGNDRVALARGTKVLIRAMVQAALVYEGCDWDTMLIQRESLQQSPVYTRIYDGYIYEIHNAMCRLVAAATDKPVGTSENTITSHALLNLCLTWGMCRVDVLRKLGREDYGTEGVSMVMEEVALMGIRLLGLPDPDKK